MPNRILKESICTSEEIDSLSAEEEVFFYRLMVVCDDFGLMDARPAILKARCYPLKSIDIKCVQVYLARLQEIGLVSVYQVDGKPYLHMKSWEKHQQIRAKRAKFPMPEQGLEIICNQLISDVTVNQSNPIQSESNPNPNLNPAEADLFDDAWSIYPSRPGASKKDSRKAWDARIKAKVSPEVILDGVRRYAAYCSAMNTEPSFIKQPATFFGPGEHYLSDWTPTLKGSNHGKDGSSRADRVSTTIAELTGRHRDTSTVIDGTAARVD